MKPIGAKANAKRILENKKTSPKRIKKELEKIKTPRPKFI